MKFEPRRPLIDSVHRMVLLLHGDGFWLMGTALAIDGDGFGWLELNSHFGHRLLVPKRDVATMRMTSRGSVENTNRLGLVFRLALLASASLLCFGPLCLFSPSCWASFAQQCLLSLCCSTPLCWSTLLQLHLLAWPPQPGVPTSFCCRALAQCSLSGCRRACDFAMPKSTSMRFIYFKVTWKWVARRTSAANGYTPTCALRWSAASLEFPVRPVGSLGELRRIWELDYLCSPTVREMLRAGGLRFETRRFLSYAMDSQARIRLFRRASLCLGS